MDTKETIINTSIELFNAHGVNRVGVREIARELNISPGNLSYHFRRKEDLLLHILQNYSRINSTIRAGYREKTPHFGRFMEMMSAIFQNQFAHRGILADIIEVDRILRSIGEVDLRSTQVQRANEFEMMLRDLQSDGSMLPGQKVLDETLGLLTLFGRFWIAEAFLRSDANDMETVNHYVSLLGKLFCNYCLEKGLLEWNEFANK